MLPQKVNIPLQGLDRRALKVEGLSGPHSQIQAITQHHSTSSGFKLSAKSTGKADQSLASGSSEQA